MQSVCVGSAEEDINKTRDTTRGAGAGGIKAVKIHFITRHASAVTGMYI